MGSNRKEAPATANTQAASPTSTVFALTELRIVDPRTGIIAACKSACAAFNSPEFCCTGAHSTPQTCSPTHYSAMFKNACPSAYSYAYDDATSTFTCSGANYLITFCPTRS
ncbi:Pathogenesis-related thaumatin superfamily protein [Raphanus sativus]|nr:Pathogenesis-related thaumatin superfamily protein [Raphanus sativus]